MEKDTRNTSTGGGICFSRCLTIHTILQGQQKRLMVLGTEEADRKTLLKRRTGGGNCKLPEEPCEKNSAALKLSFWKRRNSSTLK